MKQFLNAARLGVMLLLLSLVTIGPGWAQNGSIVDDRGQTIQIPDEVGRVVVAGTPLYTEILVDIGAKDLLVGVTESVNNPIEVDDIPLVGPSFPSPNIELIVDLNPDVVFGAVFDVRDQLEAAGLVVVTPIGFISSLQDLFLLIETVGIVVDRAAAAERVLNDIHRGVVAVEGAVVQEAPKRAAFLFASADNPPFASGKGSLEGELLSRAGGLNVFSDVAGGNVVSFEAVLDRDPEVIFTDPSQVQTILEQPLLASVSAVKNGQVFGINASSLTSTRVVDALQQMAEALHPQVVQNVGA